MIEDYRKNPFYKLDTDEEFIIKNYRLIKKKKDADLGQSEDRKGKEVRGVRTGNASYSPTQSPSNMMPSRIQHSPLSPAEITIAPESPTKRLSEEKLLIVDEQLLPQQTFQHAWESKIKVLNSIISPHTFKFSTHIGKTSSMHWEKVA